MVIPYSFYAIPLFIKFIAFYFTVNKIGNVLTIIITVSIKGMLPNHSVIIEFKILTIFLPIDVVDFDGYLSIFIIFSVVSMEL